jgi:hypothetical protein
MRPAITTVRIATIHAANEVMAKRLQRPVFDTRKKQR